MSFRELVKSVASYLPEIESPKRRPDLKRKLIWTALVALIYLLMTEIPLYGVISGGYDPLAFYRVILASARGTLMELGIGPIVTAGLIMQLLVGGEIIKLDLSDPEDRTFFTASIKLLTIVFGFVEAVAFLFSGFIVSRSLTASVIVVIQLVIATLIVMYLDELLQKGWGLGSGISLFIAMGVAQQIFWSLFSPVPAISPISNSTEPYGLIPYLAYLAISGSPVSEAFIRGGYMPSLLSFVATVFIAAVIIYAEGVRIEIPISYAQFRGFRGRYPIKLLYVSVIPVILASALMFNIFAISKLIWANFNSQNENPLLNVLGMFDPESEGNPVIGGIAYYLSPRGGLSMAMEDPFRALVFILMMIALSMLFAVVWVEVGGFSPESISQQLLDSGMQVPGFRRTSKSIALIIERYIWVVTIIGGFLVGLIAGLSQILGVFGGGMGVLLLVDILLQYYQILVREQVEEMYPAIGKLLGR